MPFPNDKTKFKKGKSGNYNGRPRKLVSHINNELKEEGYEPVTNAHIINAYEILLNLPLSKLTLIASHKIIVKELIDGKEVNVFLKEETEYPALFRMIAKAMLSQKGIDIIEKMLDRAHGKVSQTIKHEGNPLLPVIFQLDERFKED